MVRGWEQPFSQLVSELGLTLQTPRSCLYACLGRKENVQAEPLVHMEHTKMENVGGVPTRRCALCNGTTVSKTPSPLPKCSRCGGVSWLSEGRELPKGFRKMAVAMRDISEAAQEAGSLGSLFDENLAKIAMIVGADELIIWDVNVPDAPTVHASHVHVATNQILHVQAQHKRLLVAAARETQRGDDVCSGYDLDGLVRTAIFRKIGTLWMIEAVLPTGASDRHVAIARRFLRLTALMLSQNRLTR